MENTEYRSSYGRQIKFEESLSEMLAEIIKNSNKDVYNDIECLNQYQRQIKIFYAMMGGYMDDEFFDNIPTLKQEPINIVDKVSYLDIQLMQLMKLLKRKGFTPMDDDISNEWVIIEGIKKLIKAELDCQMVIHGRRGTGKSTIAIRIAQLIAEKLNVPFDVKKQIFFNTNDMRDYIYENKPTAGTPLILDDAGGGKGLGKRRAMTRENIDMFEMVQTMRELGLVIIYNAPSDEMLDSGTLSMFTTEIETIRIDKISKINIVKYKENDGKGYWKYRIDKMGNRISRTIINKPDEKSIREYKKLKKDFMYQKVKTEKPKEKKKLKRDVEGAKKHILENEDRFLSYYNGKMVFSKKKIKSHLKEKYELKAEDCVVIGDDLNEKYKPWEKFDGDIKRR